MPIKERGQYALAFGVIALMLYIVGFPVFLLVFFGVLAFFIWKVFTAEARSDTRRIFEFYLAANEILRDDERRWYGFEIKEAVARGEAITKTMSSVPPLVHFALGSLYAKLGDHSSAVRSLSQVVDETAPDESAIVFPTRDLREYVKMLRKIERTPAEAPLTSAAVRSLERARRNKAKQLLDEARARLAESIVDQPAEAQELTSVVNGEADMPLLARTSAVTDDEDETPSVTRPEKTKPSAAPAVLTERQTISEVLHDIYDKNVH